MPNNNNDDDDVFSTVTPPAESSLFRSFKELQDFQEFSGCWTVFRWILY